MLTSNGLTRRHAGWLAGTRAVAGLLLIMVFALAGTSAGAQVRVRPAAPPPAVTGNDCPSMVYAAGADLYPAMPSFHAGYDNYWERLNDTTAKWGFVVSAQFPYSQWMSWNIYNIEGVPTFTINRTGIDPDPGSVNPYRSGAAPPGAAALVPPVLDAGHHASWRDPRHAGEIRRGERGEVAEPP